MLNGCQYTPKHSFSGIPTVFDKQSSLYPSLADEGKLLREVKELSQGHKVVHHGGSPRTTASGGPVSCCHTPTSAQTLGNAAKAIRY